NGEINMTTSDIFNELDERMTTAVQAFTRNLATVRAGRANPSILDNVFVDYYGMQTPLKQLATIGTPEARLLVITPFDKSSISEIEKAIQKADLGLSPSSDGNIVRINIPTLTEERRKELTKVVGKYSEEAKIQIRNVRRVANDQLKKLEKSSEITEDELKFSEEKVQKSTDAYIDEVDKLSETKESEIMEV